MKEHEKAIPADFYASYSTHKDYQTPSLRTKDIARFDREIWEPASFSKSLSCLELGSGTGAFLAYLAYKGLSNFQGIDHDDSLLAVQPDEVVAHYLCSDIWQYLKACEDESFDRIILLDVFEHFSPDEGFRLLSMIKKVLKDQGKIVVRVPNMSSPWGSNYQFGDLTHKTAYNSGSLNQLATACGLHVESIYGQRRGNKRRMLTDAIVHRFLSWALLTPPPFWGANLYCILTLPKTP